MRQEDYSQARSLSDSLGKLGFSPSKAPKPAPKPVKSSYTPEKAMRQMMARNGRDGKDGLDARELSPEEIASKLNSLEGAVDAKVIANMPAIPTATDIISEMRSLKGNDRLDISNIRNGEQLAQAAQKISMNDMRWHGGGLSSVTTDSTLTGNGTASSPLHVVAGGTGTVTSVSVVTANGVSGSVATPTSTPAITLSLGAITPSSVASAGTVTGSNLSGTNTGDQTSVTGNAGTATALQTGRTIAVTGDLSYTSPSFDGTSNVTAAGTLATVNSNVGTFGSATQASVVTVNAKGLVTAASNATVTPAVGSITGLGTNVSTFLATPSSANLAAALTDETGTGANVFAAKPTFVGTIQTVTAMAAQALDGSTANVFTRTLAGSEVFTQSNFSTGQCFMVEVKQGSGTSYTVTWFSTITWITSGGTAPVQTTTSNGFTTYGFRCTGSNTFQGYLIATN